MSALRYFPLDIFPSSIVCEFGFSRDVYKAKPIHEKELPTLIPE